MSELWTGQSPSNQAPEVNSLTVKGANEVDAGTQIEFELNAVDPNGKQISVEWKLRREADAYITAGDFQPTPKEISGAISKSCHKTATVNAPTMPGLYRLYAIVGDGGDVFATASVAFRVKQAPLKANGDKIALPVVIYDDASDLKNHLVKLEHNGDAAAAAIDADFNAAPKFGKQCLRFTSGISHGVVGGAVTYYRENQNLPIQAMDLSGAKKLTVWLKGKNGNEKVTIGIGKVDANGDDIGNASDTTDKRKKVQLTRHWKKHELFFSNTDLRRIRHAFVWSVQNNGNPIEFYVDKITIE